MYRIKLNYKTKGWNVQRRIFFIWFTVHKNTFYNYADAFMKAKELENK